MTGSRLTISLTPKTVAALDQAMKREGLTASQISTRAIQVYDYIQAAVESGGQLLIKTANGEIDNVVIV